MPTDDDQTPNWKKRVMKGGDWVDPDAEPAPVRADKTISVRLTEAELTEFDAQIARLGIKRNRALRIAARRIGGFVEADPAQVEALRDVARQLVGVARNINQIAKSANRTRDPDYRAFMEERAALGKVLARVQGETQIILDLAARREDGLARLGREADE
ncbi:DNA mobilization endonuclease VirD1/MobC family subunit [uncultured Jannaschia sp.]|uniref:DNA mobilization endonuclease VirD1/MobC family subunit n=1 Tax=uncultured Jannaschia sp. TaxID=293347 RepID=UPI0026375F6A|nr:DNA mobilization endonuclease VirD1/MobC family subunit [uncultured Jannaschia sp.]